MRSNSELLSKTSTEVLLSFEEGRSQLQRTIESFQAMQLPIDNLVAASKKPGRYPRIPYPDYSERPGGADGDETCGAGNKGEIEWLFTPYGICVSMN
jgi:hypothetical protein